MDFIGLALDIPQTKTPLELFSELAEEATVSELVQSDLRDAKMAKMRLLIYLQVLSPDSPDNTRQTTKIVGWNLP